MAQTFRFENAEGDEERTRKLNWMVGLVANVEGPAGPQGPAGDDADADLRAWEAEAERMTVESYASTPEDVFVTFYTSNGDGTFTETTTAEYSQLHYIAKAQAQAAESEASRVASAERATASALSAAESKGYRDTALACKEEAEVSAAIATAATNYKGIWDDTTTYALGESVFRVYWFYISNTVSVGVDPLSNPTEWTKVATAAAPTNHIGEQGAVGFGVAAIDDAYLPAGFVKLSGHDIPGHDNYGNVVDSSGSEMVYIPKFYFKWYPDNTLGISALPLPDYVIHRAFVDGNTEGEGFFIDKYQCGNVNGVFVANQGIDPCSTSAAHNLISVLTVAPESNYGGLYEAVAGRGTGYNLTAIYQYNALAMLAYAHGKAATSTVACAFSDVLPYMQKGNNNDALSDANDSTVTFSSSGYSNCALTGSGVPFAKTTHNGQACGVADINGNMWEVAAGLIYIAKTGAVGTSGTNTVTMSNSLLAVGDIVYFGGTPSEGSTYNTAAYTVTDVAGDVIRVNTNLERDILSTDGVYSPKYFRSLKSTASLSDIVDDAQTQASGGAYDIDLYDYVDLTGIITANDISSRFGNSTNQVFDMSTDTSSDVYKRTCSNIPSATGKSGGGTTEFGNDYFLEYMKNQLACVVGGGWLNTLSDGAFALSLSNYRTSSNYSVGGRASYFVS